MFSECPSLPPSFPVDNNCVGAVRQTKFIDYFVPIRSSRSYIHNPSARSSCGFSASVFVSFRASAGVRSCGGTNVNSWNSVIGFAGPGKRGRMCHCGKLNYCHMVSSTAFGDGYFAYSSHGFLCVDMCVCMCVHTAVVLTNVISRCYTVCLCVWCCGAWL